MAVHRIFLVASQTQESVEAQLHDAANAELLTRWEREWVPDLERAKQQLAAKNVPRAEWPHDLHWDWRKPFEQAQKRDDMCMSVCRKPVVDFVGFHSENLSYPVKRRLIKPAHIGKVHSNALE